MASVFLSDGRGADAQALGAYLAAKGYEVIINRADADGCRRVDVDASREEELRPLLAGVPDLAAAVYFAPPPAKGTIEHADDAHILDAFRGGTLAAMALAQAAGDQMAQRRHGALVFVGDIHADKPTGSAPLHAMQMAAVAMLSREASMDLGRRGVNCFYVMRGQNSVDEPLESTVSNQWAGAQYRHPDGKLPEPGYLNDLIAFLLTDGARPLNGADLRADGGRVLYYGLTRSMEAAQ